MQSCAFARKTSSRLPEKVPTTDKIYKRGRVEFPPKLLVTAIHAVTKLNYTNEIRVVLCT